MRRLALTAVPLFALTAPFTPSLAADLDGPVYRERDVVIERPAPPVVRERIIERNYYYEAEPAPPSVPMRRPTTPMPRLTMATRLGPTATTTATAGLIGAPSLPTGPIIGTTIIGVIEQAKD